MNPDCGDGLIKGMGVDVVNPAGSSSSLQTRPALPRARAWPAEVAGRYL